MKPEGELILRKTQLYAWIFFGKLAATRRKILKQIQSRTLYAAEVCLGWRLELKFSFMGNGPGLEGSAIKKCLDFLTWPFLSLFRKFLWFLFFNISLIWCGPFLFLDHKWRSNNESSLKPTFVVVVVVHTCFYRIGVLFTFISIACALHVHCRYIACALQVHYRCIAGALQVHCNIQHKLGM